MNLHPIEQAYKKMNDSIRNTAEKYPEGRNILIHCLSRNAQRTELEVIEWLKNKKIKVKDLNQYVIKDGSDRPE